MITEIRCDCALKGKDFSPRLLSIPSEIRIVKDQKFGDTIKVGRFEGSMSEEGILIIDGNVDDVLVFMEKLINSEHMECITELSINLTVCYKEQCNFELTNDYLCRFSSMGVPLGITCFEAY